MGQFLWPDWKPLPQDSPLPPPSPDPEQAIADNTRAEEALNQFIAARQNALFEAPDAFYRTQGSDAIHAAPVILDRLSRLRDDSLDSLANEAQRDRLGSALDAHLQLARDDITRHVAEQSLAWQRKTAQDRIGLLTKEAAYHHNDDELVDALGHAASNAARAHARGGDAPLDPQAEDAAAAFARSGVLTSAIQARLDRGDKAGADVLLKRMKADLDRQHAPLVQGQILQFDAPAPDSVGQYRPLPSSGGVVVTLPDGSTIPDEKSPTGKVMSPTSSLAAVAAGGRKAGADYRALLANPGTAENAVVSLATNLGLALGHGGTFDYQRGPGNSITGFEQRPQFRSISNVNVGVYGQQAGLSLDEILKIAGAFAYIKSHNTNKNEPYFLDPETRRFIEKGYELGASGKLDKSLP